MWNTTRDEVRELVWLASMVGGLSALGVGIQLTLLRTYDGKVCGERCPAGQGLSHTGDTCRTPFWR